MQAEQLQVASLPLLEIGAAADPAQAQQAWRLLPQARLAIFVSPNAVEQFFAQAPQGASWPAQTLAATVGPGSAAALLAHGVPPEQVRQPPADAPSFDSEQLWPQLSGEDWQGRLALVLRGEGGREWLAERLREQGAEVRQLAVYQRGGPQLTADELALLDAALAQPSDYVLLFSSAEAAQHLAALRPDADWSRAQALATHARIAETLRGLGFAQARLVKPDAAAIAAAVRSLA